MAVVPMPRLSDAGEEATIVRWLVADGAEVRAGDDLVEIETDKATMTYQAEASGTLRHRQPEGATVRLGEPIASIGEDGGEAAPAAPTPAAVAEPALAAAAPAAAAQPVAAAGRPRESGRVRASPRARAVAQRLGVDLAALAGTGPGGRIVSGDVDRHASAAPAPEPAPAPDAARNGDAHETTWSSGLSATQRTIARRMVEAKAAPEFVAERDVDVGAVLAERTRLRERELPVPSLNDVLVKAVALALREHPRVNASWRDDVIVEHHRIHVGIAVAAPGTLLVPVVRDADRLSLAELGRTTRDLAERARAGKLASEELRGGTFTVSNLGMLGVDAFTAILNPPQAAILAVGATREVPALAGRRAGRPPRGAAAPDVRPPGAVRRGRRGVPGDPRALRRGAAGARVTPDVEEDA